MFVVVVLGFLCFVLLFPVCNVCTGVSGRQKMTLGALELETNSNVGTGNKVPSEQALCVLLQH